MRVREQEVHVIARCSERICFEGALPLSHSGQHSSPSLLAWRHVRSERCQLVFAARRDVLSHDRLQDGRSRVRPFAERGHRVGDEARPGDERHFLPVSHGSALQAEKSGVIRAIAILSSRSYIWRVTLAPAPAGLPTLRVLYQTDPVVERCEN